MNRGGSRRGHDGREGGHHARTEEAHDELRERVVRRVIEDDQHGAIARVADRLGINRETLCNWVKVERDHETRGNPPRFRSGDVEVPDGADTRPAPGR